jgi:hypothetical protein
MRLDVLIERASIRSTKSFSLNLEGLGQRFGQLDLESLSDGVKKFFRNDEVLIQVNLRSSLNANRKIFCHRSIEHGVDASFFKSAGVSLQAVVVVKLSTMEQTYISI